MDDGGRLDGGGARPDGPRPRLLGPGREETAQTEAVVGGPDQRREGPLAEAQLLEHVGPLGLVELGRLRLELDARRHDLGVAASDSAQRLHAGPGLGLGQLVLAQVQHVEDRLVGEEERRRQAGAALGVGPPVQRDAVR